MSRVCADTGFLIALYGEQDQSHDRASAWFEQLFAKARHQLLLPWPALYEAINTRLVASPRQIMAMDRELRLLRKNEQLEYLNDQPYREDALADVFAETGRRRHTYRELSLADRVIRALIGDEALKIHALLTNDESAFYDVCRSRGLQMIPIFHEI